MRHFVNPFWVILATVLLSACSSEQAPNSAPVAGELSVEFAWIRTAPPSSQVLGGYMTVNNGLAGDLTLLSAESDRFGAIEFHQVTMQDGQMRMRELEHVGVPANSQRQLAPNENHLMLFNPTKPVQRGERIHVRFNLQYSDGQQGPLDVWFLVRDKGPTHGH